MEWLNHIYREPKRINAQLRITMDSVRVCVWMSITLVNFVIKPMVLRMIRDLVTPIEMVVRLCPWAHNDNVLCIFTTCTCTLIDPIKSGSIWVFFFLFGIFFGNSQWNGRFSLFLFHIHVIFLLALVWVEIVTTSIQQ